MGTNERLGCTGFGLLLSLSCAGGGGEHSDEGTPKGPAPGATQTSVLQSSASAQPTGNPTPTGDGSVAPSSPSYLASSLSDGAGGAVSATSPTQSTGDGSMGEPDGADSGPGDRGEGGTDGGSAGHDAAVGPPPRALAGRVSLKRGRATARRA